MNRISPTSLLPSVQQSIRTFTSAVQLLQEGKIIIYPTETFFAVGCSMHHIEALEGIFSAKNRVHSKPLPLLAANFAQVHAIAHVSSEEEALAKAFWPGSLTLLCKAKEHVPLSITAGTGRVAVRISPHDIAQALAQALGAPLVCSSANISGEAPPRISEEISLDLLPRVHGLLVEGKEPQGGLPSTIVEVCGKKIRIRRHGAISMTTLEARMASQGWTIVCDEA